MAALTVIYWRDIPAQVLVKAGRQNAKRQLSDRFQEAIDMAAMKAGLHGTDGYLSAWRRAEPTDCGDDLEAEATAAATRLEQDYPDTRLASLARAGGQETLLEARP